MRLLSEMASAMSRRLMSPSGCTSSSCPTWGGGGGGGGGSTGGALLPPPPQALSSTRVPRARLERKDVDGFIVGFLARWHTRGAAGHRRARRAAWGALLCGRAGALLF